MNEHVVVIKEVTTHLYRVVLDEGDVFDQRTEAKGIAYDRFRRGDPGKQDTRTHAPRWEWAVTGKED